MMLHVALRDGFRNDTVTIRVNGKQVYKRSGVTSDLVIASADSVEVPDAGGTVTLEVAVEGGQIRREQVGVADTPFVAVRIVGGNMEFRKSSEAIPML